MTGAVDRFGGYNGDLAIKAPVKAATTVNITLSGEQTIDGIACVSGDRVLARAQTTGNLNGIYIVSSSGWSRAADFDGARDIVSGTNIPVASGTVYGAKFLQITTLDPIIIGTTALSFAIADISGSAAYAAQAAASAAAAQAAVGAVKVTASDTTASVLNSALSFSSSFLTTVNNPGADEVLALDLVPQNAKVKLNLQPKKTLIVTSGTFTTSANITTSTVHKITLKGGGGGGGGTIANAFAAAGGAGEGGIAIVFLTGLTPSTGYTITIGALGTGGLAGGNNGMAGGNSSAVFGGITVAANGGNFGSGGNQTANAFSFSGSGGTPAGTYDIGYFGQSGTPGFAVATGQALGGPGGGTLYGMGGTYVAAANGANATGYGTGGSGAGGTAGGTKAGGNGTAGLCLIEWLE